ncbi:MAG: hypothetical protein ACQETI_03655 [Halobacteriota archaeon]
MIGSSGAAVAKTPQRLPDHVPGMRSRAIKRNVLVGLLYLLLLVAGASVLRMLLAGALLLQTLFL